jgi:hypothetical protein
VSGDALTRVAALAALPNGDLFVGGTFTSAGGVPTSSIARWDGASWTALGAGLNNLVRSIAVLPSGDIITGGDFTASGSTTVNRIARWNDVTQVWSPLGTGMDGNVRALTVGIDGVLFAGGDFTQSGGTAASRVARWSGESWFAIGTGMSGIPPAPIVSALATLPGGDVIASGNFTNSGAILAPSIARYYFGAPAPILSLQPAPLTVCPEAGATFSVAASGTGTLTYRWRKNSVLINTTTNPSAATPTLELSSLQPADSGPYDCIIGSACGSTTSAAAQLTVLTTSQLPCIPCDYDFNQDENTDLLDVQQMAQVFVGLLTREPHWLEGDVNGDENADLTDAQQLATYIVTGVCGV